MNPQENRSWKQPIPTNLKHYCNNDAFAATVLAILLLRCSSSNTTIYIGDTSISLVRGQAVCGRVELAKCLGLKKNEADRVRRILDKLEKTHKQITKQKSKDCTIVTILNYEDFVRMTKPLTDLFANTDQSITTNKSEKTDETIKNIVSIDTGDGLYHESSFNELISLFQSVNPSYKNLYKNKSERAALQRMVNENGMENIVKAVQSLASIYDEPFAPIITSPIELERKLGQLIGFLKKTKAKYRKGVLKL